MRKVAVADGGASLPREQHRALQVQLIVTRVQICEARRRSSAAGTVDSLSMAASTSISERPGRNEPCHCGSGSKYKHCCLEKDDAQATAARAKAAAAADEQTPETATSARTRAPKHHTEQPWKTATSRGFVPRTRTPRKVGGG